MGGIDPKLELLKESVVAKRGVLMKELSAAYKRA